MGPAPSGCIRLYIAKGVPLFVHWTLLLGGPGISLLIPPFRLQILYFSLGYALLVFIHEAGHASAAVFLGMKVYSIQLSAFGARCHTSTPKSFGAAILFSVAGVAIQSVLLVVTALLIASFGYPRSALGASFVAVFVFTNAWIILISLIPGKSPKSDVGTDGYLLLTLLANRRLGRAYAYPDTSPTFSPSTQLAQLKDFLPAGFTHGIEVLNDNTTTFEFVVTTLSTHLQVSTDQATNWAVAVHTKGGIMIPLSSADAAAEAAADICKDALANGHKFVCRAVSVALPVQSG